MACWSISPRPATPRRIAATSTSPAIPTRRSTRSSRAPRSRWTPRSGSACCAGGWRWYATTSPISRCTGRTCSGRPAPGCGWCSAPTAPFRCAMSACRDGALRALGDDLLVGGNGEPLREALRLEQRQEDRRRVGEAAFRVGLAADRRLEPGELLLEKRAAERQVDGAAVGEPRLVADPLPHLRAADLRGGRVLHQVVERHAAGAPEPRLEIADADIEVLPEPRLGDRALGHRQQIGGRDTHVLPLARDLVRLGHLLVEDLL